ncbi:DUF1289 domain-containing protein [Robbsia sp. Bb-Pol-6]|uniref:DUF1289 domain-containing protein n=1 Tax=Robbsia betulipollinis TaxID=2981849 RepID=A0ABT3ZH04_9BURK|nr:DUF1289 domain-containing protein [Robbsia betulipollinis]MCY0385702.1 DUF1289 domain-containing protein [Robbsia betulipollinis]
MSETNQAVIAAVAASREIHSLADTVARAGARDPVGSPCTNVCRLDVETRSHCIGCYRSRAEIKGWKTMDDAAKRAILATLLTRQDAHPA